VRRAGSLVTVTPLRALLGLSLCAVLASVPACAAGSSGLSRDAGGLTGTRADEAVRAHNAWRQRSGVRPLRWAADLAAMAQARAGYLATHGCVIEHGILPADIGENLYWAGPLQGPGLADELFVVTPSHVVDMWGAEWADYSTADGRCAPGRECGHFTQLVWATTEEVGCGTSVCPTLGQVWVCNYRPRGNVYRSQVPLTEPLKPPARRNR